MAAASATEPEHNTTAGGTDRAHGSKQHRRRLLSHHLHIQVPVPASSGWSGRPSGPASAPCGGCNPRAHLHQDHRPASPPSLLRSPTAWIRSKGHGRHGGGFGLSSKHTHTPRRYGTGNNNFHYDARSYAQNFDEGGGRDEDNRYLSLRLLASSPQHRVSPSPSNLQGTSGGGSSNDEEPARETLYYV